MFVGVELFTVSKASPPLPLMLLLLCSMFAG